MYRVACLLLTASALADTAPQQPIAYSHATHIALGLTCRECHANADPGKAMGFPASAKCMACHRTIKTESPEIQKLAGYVKKMRDVPWVRVYRIPNTILFSHRAHLAAGAKCEDCHGPVARRDILTKEIDFSMGACANCHRDGQASSDCATCHGPQ
jgi:hypothetical protein